MNVFAKFDEIPSMILEVIKETKRYGHTVGRSDNVKTVYPPTNTVCGGYNDTIPGAPQSQQSLFPGKLLILSIMVRVNSRTLWFMVGEEPVSWNAFSKTSSFALLNTDIHLQDKTIVAAEEIRRVFDDNSKIILVKS